MGKAKVKELLAGPPIAPLELFPMEVWSMIFGNLDVKDLLSCTYATEEFNNFYKPKRTTLFMEGVLPSISEYLRPADRVNCRLVCRDWRNVVDNYIQNHPVHYDNGMMLRVQCPNDHIFGEGTIFGPFERDVVKLERLADTNFIQKKSNPFSVTKYLYYKEAPDSSIFHFSLRNIARQRQALKKLLNRLGREVRHCKLSFNNRDTTAELYRVVRCWLTLMPNLKTLALLHSGHDHPRYAMTPSLQNMLRSEPLPPLPQLVSMSIFVGGSIEVGALNVYSGHVQKLNCVNIQGSYRFPNEKARVPQLEELITSIMGFGSLLPVLKNYPSPIKALKLSGTLNTFLYQQPIFAPAPYPTDGKYPAPQKIWSQNDQLEVLFRDVSHFGASLRYFDLQFFWVKPKVTNSVFMSKENLSLPLLQTLKIDAGGNQVPVLDFLLPCKSLQHLSIKVNIATASGRIRRTKAPPSTIQFTGYEDTLYDSNIWKIFPKLLSVKLWATLEVETKPTKAKKSRGPTTPIHPPETISKYSYYRNVYEALANSSSN